MLAKFNIKQAQAQSPLDLGAILPIAATQWMNDPTTLDLAPNQTVTMRFVVTFEGLYDFKAVSTGLFGVAFVSVHGSSGAESTSNTVDNPRNLNPGVYEYQITSLSSAPIQLQYVLGTKSDFDSLLLNGVGQGPALNLRLIDTTADPSQTPTTTTTTTTAPTTTSTTTTSPSPSPSSGGIGSTVVSVPVQTEPNTGGAASPSVFGNTFAGITSIPGISSSAALTSGSQPVGLPTIDAEHVAAVGSGILGADVAAAGSPTAILQALVRDGDLVSPLPDDQPTVAENVPERAVEAQTDGSIVFDSVATKVRFDGPERLETAAIDLSWFNRIRDRFDDALSFGSETRRAAAKRVPELAALLDPTAEPESIAAEDKQGEHKGHLDRAALISPLSFGLASLVLLRARRRRLRGTSLTAQTTASAAPSRGIPARPNHPRGPLSAKSRKII